VPSVCVPVSGIPISTPEELRLVLQICGLGCKAWVALQIIVRVAWTPENYLVAQKQASLAPPPRCPNCSASGSLVALGYYERWLSGLAGKHLRISVRRFRCHACRRTVSLLPDFAQPYRLIRNQEIERHFSRIDDMAEQPNASLLRRYWGRFKRWLPELRRVVGVLFGRSPPASEPRKWWSFLISASGDLAQATRLMTTQLHVTIFGRYRCHQPGGA
jgi:hypothetical protein